jgi:hypothetical protein
VISKVTSQSYPILNVSQLQSTYTFLLENVWNRQSLGRYNYLADSGHGGFFSEVKNLFRHVSPQPHSYFHSWQLPEVNYNSFIEKKTVFVVSVITELSYFTVSSVTSVLTFLFSI